MIRIQIPKNDIIWAKEETQKFDSQKTYNKYECNNNYFGILGEKVLHDWMTGIGIPHEWVKFLKQGWDDPDFIINDEKIDLKTTKGTALMVSKVVFDTYIFSRVNEDVKTLFLIGFIKGSKLQRLIDEGKLDILKLDNGINYRCPISEMKPIETLFLELFKDKDQWTDKVRRLSD